jgi:hypothetical protein
MARPFGAEHNEEKGDWEYWTDEETAEVVHRISGI